jgi:hypothetical protein
MSQTKQSRALSWGTICLFALLFQSGCVMAVATLKGEPGKDVSSIKPGISKQEAEEILGSPIREWITPLNIHYCVYSYDAGIPPSVADAAFFAFFGIITAGLYDLYEATGITKMNEMRERLDRVTEKIAISYDANDTIVGVFGHFGDFDVLPDDGRAGK